MHNLKRYRSLFVPLASALLSLLWLIFDPSFEPAIVLIVSIAASIVAYTQIKNDWTPRTNNYIYSVQIRSPIPIDIDSCVNAILESEPGIIKWKLYHHDGEFKDLVLESMHKLNPEKMSELAWKHRCKPYSVALGSEIIWETDAI